MKKLKAWRGLGNQGARIYSLSLHLESWGLLITPPDFYLHTHWADFRLYKLGIRGQSNEIIYKQGNSKNIRINWKKNVIYYSIRKWTRTHENVPIGPDSMSLDLKKWAKGLNSYFSKEIYKCPVTTCKDVQPISYQGNANQNLRYFFMPTRVTLKKKRKEKNNEGIFWVVSSCFFSYWKVPLAPAAIAVLIYQLPDCGWGLLSL